MRCRKARRLMLLYREEDLPQKDRAALTRHYASCTECARESQQVAADFAPLDLLRRAQPSLDDPHALALKIMREVDAVHQPALSGLHRSQPFQRILPVIRLAGAAAACALVILYATLSYNDARTVAALEERIGQQQKEKGSTAEQYAREAASQLQSRSGRAYAEAGLRPDDMGRLLQALLNSRQKPAQVTIEDYLLRKYPALASVTLQDGLNDRERSILANEGERFRKDLEKLIREERISHER